MAGAVEGGEVMSVLVPVLVSGASVGFACVVEEVVGRNGVMLPTPVIVDPDDPEEPLGTGSSEEGGGSEDAPSKTEDVDEGSTEGDGCGTPSTQAGRQPSTKSVISKQLAPLGSV